MLDYDVNEPDLDEVDAAFRELRTSTISRLTPGGLGAARATARRRRKMRVRAAAGVVVLALVSPVAVLIGLGQHGSAGSRLPVGTPIDGHPSPYVSTDAPSVVPTDRGAEGFCPPPSTVSLRGGISEQELCNSTLEIPPWSGGSASCPAGPLAFADGAFLIDPADAITLGAVDGQSANGLLPIAYTTGLGDGTVDAIVQVNCEGGANPPSQVLVLRPDQDGTIQTVGTVVSTGRTIKAISAIRALASGDIKVQVADFEGEFGIRQWRTYRWNHSTFVQVAGPTAFPPNSKLKDLSVTASALRFAPATGGARVGTMSITTSETGFGGEPYTLTVDVPLWARFQALPAGCVATPLDDANVDELVCSWTGTPGSPRQVTLRLTAPATPDRSNDTQPAVFVGFVGAGVLDTNGDNDSAAPALILD